MVIGISPFLENGMKDGVYRGIVRLVVEELPLGTSLWIYDANLHRAKRAGGRGGGAVDVLPGDPVRDANVACDPEHLEFGLGGINLESVRSFCAGGIARGCENGGEVTRKSGELCALTLKIQRPEARDFIPMNFAEPRVTEVTEVHYDIF